MINSKLYKLRQEYAELLKDRVENQYTCPECGKLETKCTLTNIDNTWESRIECPCGKVSEYSTDPEYRGYVVAQYSYILKKENPDIKIQFVEDSGVVPTQEPTVEEKPRTFKDYNFKKSTKK